MQLKQGRLRQGAFSHLQKYPKVLAGLVAARLQFHLPGLYRHALYPTQHVVCPGWVFFCYEFNKDAEESALLNFR